MHKFTAFAMTTFAAIGISGMPISPAFADSPAASHTKRSHSMNISFASGPTSSAHWAARQQAVQLAVGADGGAGLGPGAQPPEFAEIVVHHAAAAAPAQEPVFTLTGQGSPFLRVGFTSGGYLQRTAGSSSTAWTAYDSTSTVLVSATDYATALAAEQGSGPAPAVNQVILLDVQAPGGAPYTDTIGSLQYDGVNLVPHGGHHHGG